ncbi:MAG: hypothetical protein IJE98_02810 [Oscillospiraceae bacterium]|nr:hypothetical protein [Oscillospiraceae bacterium]
MIELFYENGHLTEEALQRLVGFDDFDDLQRLEIAEHLSFCEECRLRYAQLLTEEVLIEPDEPIGRNAIKAVKRKDNLLYFKRVLTVSAAACLALLFWYGGVFSWPAQLNIDPKPPRQVLMDSPKEEEPSGFDKLFGNLELVTEGLDQWTAGIMEPFQNGIFDSEKENLHGTK